MSNTLDDFTKGYMTAAIQTAVGREIEVNDRLFDRLTPATRHLMKTDCEAFQGNCSTVLKSFYKGLTGSPTSREGALAAGTEFWRARVGAAGGFRALPALRAAAMKLPLAEVSLNDDGKVVQVGAENRVLSNSSEPW